MAASNSTHEVEVNFFCLHTHDAKKFVERAEAEGSNQMFRSSRSVERIILPRVRGVFSSSLCLEKGVA